MNLKRLDDAHGKRQFRHKPKMETEMTKLVTGSADKLPSDLVKRNRNDYEWDKLNVGDHYEFDNAEDFPNIRSSAIQFARGTKKRPEGDFRTRVVTIGEGDTATKVLEVWRYPDPVKAAAPATVATKTK